MRLVRCFVVGGSLLITGVVPACTSEEAADNGVRVLGDGVHGPQRVPAGGTLEGEHSGEASVESSDSGAAIVVDTEPGKTTTVRGINVYASGGVGILVRGGGRFVGENLVVNCSIGVCVAAEDLSEVDLGSVDINGGVTKEIVPDLVFPLPAAEAPIIGLAMVNVANSNLSNVWIEGFGGFGVISVESRISWTAGAIEKNVGVGIMQHGGAVELNDVEVTETWAGEIGNAIAPFGVVLTAGSLNTNNFRVANNDGVGLVQDNALSEHTRLTVEGNGDVGVWVQNTPGDLTVPALRIHGEGNVIRQNLGGGVFALRSGGIDIEGLDASNMLVRQIATSDIGLAEMADGVQITEPAGSVRLANVTLNENARVGLLLNGVLPAGATVDITGVSITGSGTYGMLVQNEFPQPDLAGINRTQELVDKDAAVPGPVPFAAVRESVISVAILLSDGLIGDSSIVRNDGSISGGVVDESGLSSGGN